MGGDGEGEGAMAVEWGARRILREAWPRRSGLIRQRMGSIRLILCYSDFIDMSSTIAGES